MVQVCGVFIQLDTRDAEARRRDHVEGKQYQGETPGMRHPGYPRHGPGAVSSRAGCAAPKPGRHFGMGGSRPRNPFAHLPLHLARRLACHSRKVQRAAGEAWRGRLPPDCASSCAQVGASVAKGCRAGAVAGMPPRENLEHCSPLLACRPAEGRVCPVARPMAAPAVLSHGPCSPLTAGLLGGHVTCLSWTWSLSRQTAAGQTAAGVVLPSLRSLAFSSSTFCYRETEEGEVRDERGGWAPDGGDRRRRSRSRSRDRSR